VLYKESKKINTFSSKDPVRMAIEEEMDKSRQSEYKTVKRLKRIPKAWMQ